MEVLLYRTSDNKGLQHESYIDLQGSHEYCHVLKEHPHLKKILRLNPQLRNEPAVTSDKKATL